jgi:CRP-like cAMP-binding protein
MGLINFFIFLKQIRLGIGVGFGELALINDAPRVASIVALESCTLAILNK